MTEKLKIVLSMFAGFKEQELEQIAACFQARTVNKYDMLLHEGSICREFYFIHTGCVRTYFLDKNGHEKTRYVMLDNHIGTALTSFITQRPSFECLEALENTTLLAIRHADFFRLNKEMDTWKMFYQRILEMAYAFQNKKIEQLVTLTAKQRYEYILNEEPVFVQRLSNRVLASYLDIREETLSRLKSP